MRDLTLTPMSTLYPYTTLFRSLLDAAALLAVEQPPLRILVAGDGPLLGRLRARIDAEDLPVQLLGHREDVGELLDRKSTRLNSSHVAISYAVFCLKKKKNQITF